MAFLNIFVNRLSFLFVCCQYICGRLCILEGLEVSLASQAEQEIEAVLRITSVTSVLCIRGRG